MRDRWYRQDFEITDEHEKLAARINITWYTDIEWGATEFGDAKRPFGNSDMPRDVAEILGWDILDDELTPEQVERAKVLHFEMGYVAVEALRLFLSEVGNTEGEQ